MEQTRESTNAEPERLALNEENVRFLWSKTYNTDGKPDWSHIFPYYHDDIVFQDTIETYYELVNRRLPNHGEQLEELRRLRILIDGHSSPDSDERELLLQIFTQNVIGPIFFEIIQRKGNEGFGEGNFKALFESIELDQMRRGVI